MTLHVKMLIYREVLNLKSFIDKLKNNKGSAESAMFIFGLAIFATIVVFSMDTLGLTWQRYLATRELSNMSRLYAIRATDLFWDDGATQMTTPAASKLGNKMGETLELLVGHGNLTRATLTIQDAGGVQLFKIEAEDGTSNITSAPWEIFREVDYGDTLYAKLNIQYKRSGLQAVASQSEVNNEYTITNKFAYEIDKSTSEWLG